MALFRHIWVWHEAAQASRMGEVDIQSAGGREGCIPSLGKSGMGARPAAGCE